MARNKTGTRAYLTAEQRRTEIVEAAFQCLQAVGYARLTARKIAEASGISLGHITYNFKDMKEVLVETYRHASSILYDATQKSLGDAPETAAEQLRAFLNAGFAPSVLREDYIRVRVDLWSAALSHAEIARTELALYQRYRDHLAVIISRVASERGRDQDQVPLLVDTIMATLDGLWLDWGRRQSMEAVENGLAGCVRLVDALIPQ